MRRTLQNSCFYFNCDSHHNRGLGDAENHHMEQKPTGTEAVCYQFCNARDARGFGTLVLIAAVRRMFVGIALGAILKMSADWQTKIRTIKDLTQKDVVQTAMATMVQGIRVVRAFNHQRGYRNSYQNKQAIKGSQKII